LFDAFDRPFVSVHDDEETLDDTTGF